MALNTPRAWLVAYDITDDKRRGRVHRLVVKRCLPVQYSLYYFEGSPRSLQNLFADIDELINPRADDVRAYPLPAHLDVVTLGRGSLPGQTSLLSATYASLAELLQPRKA